MNNPNVPENSIEEGLRQRRWDELDQKFWALYQTIDEGKLHRNFRLLLVGGLVILGLDLCCAMYFLAIDLSSFIGWMFALFIFGCAFFFVKQIRREAAVWAPEKVPS